MKIHFCAMLAAAVLVSAPQNVTAHERHTTYASTQAMTPEPAAAPRPERPAIHRISNDRGGNVVVYAQRVAQVRSEPSIVVFDGMCASACTMFLSLSNTRTCLMPGASFVFHRAYGASRDMNEWGTDYMMRQYPQWVRDWIGQRGGLSRNLIRMDFTYASRFMPVCQVVSA